MALPCDGALTLLDACNMMMLTAFVHHVVEYVVSMGASDANSRHDRL